MTPKQKTQLEKFLELLLKAQEITKEIGKDAIPYHEEKWAEALSLAQGNLLTAILNLKKFKDEQLTKN